MTEEDRRYIERLLTNAEEAVRFFSNAGKAERERLSCAMFLRALGEPFSVEELVWVPDGQDPPDVKFRGARFEVRELLDEGRRRYDEVKARRQQYGQMKTADDIFVDVPNGSPISHGEVYTLLLAALAEKASRYGVKGCGTLDALVCIQLRDRFLYPAPPLPDCTTLVQQGWRSVSIIMPMYSYVVYATDAAPAFLQEHVGQTRRQWEDSDTFFRL
jgi:Putative endonuclease, protein of unknown function (DUF1780)